jgi:O-antigen/teichoic acid export membrane protein
MINVKKAFLSGTFKDTLISLSGNGLIAVGGAAFTIVIARSFSPDKFGLFSALWSLGILLASLGDFGISAALTNFLPKFRDDRSSIISLTFWLQLIIALILGLVAVNFLFFRQILIPGSESTQYLFVGFLVFIYILEAFIENVFNAERRFVTTTSLQAGDSLIKLILLAFLYFNLLISIETVFLATTTSALIITLIGLSKEFKNISLIFPKYYIKKIFSFTKWIALTRIFSVAVARIDIILLASLSSTFQAGIFSAASRIALIFTLLASSLGNVTAPRFSAFTSHADIVKYIKKLLLLASLLSFGMIFTAAIATPLITIIFGTKYFDSIIVFRYLTLAMIPFMFTIVTINPLIYYFNKPKFIAKTTIIQVIALIALDYLLIPKFGAIGPTISLGITNLLVLIITGIKIRQLFLK